MTFSIEFYANDKEEAKRRIFDAYAPPAIQLFLISAVNAYRNVADGEQLYVRAHGHLFDGNSYDVSSAQIEVKKILKA